MFSSHHFSRLAGRGAITIAAAIALSAGAPASAAEVSFAGKVARVVINLGVASGLSAHHQIFIPFVAKYLPGKPKIIVETKPGGRGVLGAAYMAKNVKPDGLTMATFAIITGTVATGEKMPVDLTKFVYVGSTGQGSIIYANAASGLKTVDDFKNPPHKILIGSSGPNASIQLAYRLFLHAVGAKNKYQVFAGYRGMLGSLQAVRSGEVNCAILHAGQYMSRLDSLKKAKIRGLVELGLPTKDGRTVPTSGLGVPTVYDAWLKLAPRTVDSDLMRAFKTIQIAKAASWIHVLPPGTPEAYRAAWEKAFEMAYADPAYLAILKKRDAPPARFTDGVTTYKMMKDMIAQSKEPRIKAAIKEVTYRK